MAVVVGGDVAKEESDECIEFRIECILVGEDEIESCLLLLLIPAASDGTDDGIVVVVIVVVMVVVVVVAMDCGGKVGVGEVEYRVCEGEDDKTEAGGGRGGNAPLLLLVLAFLFGMSLMGIDSGLGFSR